MLYTFTNCLLPTARISQAYSVPTIIFFLRARGGWTEKRPGISSGPWTGRDLAITTKEPHQGRLCVEGTIWQVGLVPTLLAV